MATTTSIHSLAGMISEISSGIEVIEGNRSLFETSNFISRADAIDFLDFHIIDRMEGLYQHHDAMALLKQHAEKLKSKMEIIDTDLFRQVREKIGTGVYTTSSFKEMIHYYMGSYFDEPAQAGYDHLDTFINGILSDNAIPAPTAESETEMVFYQKTPARIIFELTGLDAVNREDIFYDIGSGLGQAVILAHLLCKCAARGIEYEPAFCEYAKTSAANLNLSRVEFTNANALKCDYSDGTLFFLYTPFVGKMLQDLLDKLQNESRKRPVNVFTYGPCSSIVARQHWLYCERGQTDNPDNLCMFKSIT